MYNHSIKSNKYKEMKGYLNMNIKSMRRPKNTATLSIVLSITTNCLLKLGRNRTSFKILSSLNVRRTDNPEPSAAIP